MKDSQFHFSSSTPIASSFQERDARHVGASMSGAEGLAYIHSRTWLGSRLGLSRTRTLLAGLGNPEQELRFVHIAGTNGKGSTAAMLASILRAAGYRTGLNTSPYLEKFNERIQINGEMISDDDLGELMSEIKCVADTMDDPPTEFELVTVLALLYFKQKNCDIVVLEVGMGGLLDSTNVIEAPEAAVITTIGLDHTKELGETVEKIAAAKAGIIKPNCDVVLYPQQPSVEQVISEICITRGARLKRVDFSRCVSVTRSMEGQVFRWDDSEFFLPLLGEHQIHNAAVALTTVELLQKRGWQISSQAIRRGFETTSWPARFEVLHYAPLFVVDGGHNPQCVTALVQNIKDYIPSRPITFLVGVLADKNFDEMFCQVAPLASSFVTVTPDSPRALSASALSEQLARYGKPVHSCCSIDLGIREAQRRAGENGVVCAFGSLYMAGAIRGYFKKH